MSRRIPGTDQYLRQYIETVPKLNYRFAAIVSKVTEEAGNMAAIGEARMKIPSGVLCLVANNTVGLERKSL